MLLFFRKIDDFSPQMSRKIAGISLQHFNLLLLSDPMFPFSYHSFQTDPQAGIGDIPDNCRKSMRILQKFPETLLLINVAKIGWKQKGVFIFHFQRKHMFIFMSPIFIFKTLSWIFGASARKKKCRLVGCLKNDPPPHAFLES